MVKGCSFALSKAIVSDNLLIVIGVPSGQTARQTRFLA